MATQGGLPYGLTDLVIEPLDASDTPSVGDGLKLTNGQTLTVTVNEDETTVEGYGVKVGTVYSATEADVELQYAGIDLDAEAAISGGTISVTGTTPNIVQTLNLGVEGQARPYCRITGRALGNNGGDAWLRVNKVRFSLPKGGFDHKAFLQATLAGKAVVPTAGAADGILITRIHHETATALTPA